VPFAETDLCAQGPPIWTTASAAGHDGHLTWSSRGDLGALAIGLLVVGAQHPEPLGHGLARLAQAGYSPQLQVGDPEHEDREQHVDAGHDEERGPVPDTERDQAERQRDGQQHEHQASHEGGHDAQGPGQPDPLDVVHQLALGQVDLVPDQLGHVLGRQGDEIPK
jgi:hypothetical protein